jgi:hypothetical protein
LELVQVNGVYEHEQVNELVQVNGVYEHEQVNELVQVNGVYEHEQVNELVQVNGVYEHEQVNELVQVKQYKFQIQKGVATENRNSPNWKLGANATPRVFANDKTLLIKHV